MRPLTPLIALLFCPVAHAATLTVGASGTYATIGDAVNNANNGDIIEVEPGVYAEAVLVDVNVDIVGTGGSSATTVSSSGAAAFIVDGADVTIEGFTLDASSNQGMIIFGGSNAVLRDLFASGFNAGNDGGVFDIDDSVVEIFDSAFDGNSGFDDGGVLRADFSLVVCTNCDLTNNSASDDGGVARLDGSELVLIDSTVEGNSAGDNGGVVVAFGGSVTAINTVLDGNIATNEGGVYYLDDSFGLVEGSTAEGNSAGVSGGVAMGVNNSLIELEASSFVLNTSGTTGGVARGTASDVVSIGSTFEANSSAYGGALYGRAELVVSGSEFFDNLGTVNGGAIRWFPDAGEPELSVANSTFLNNVAVEYGGAIGAVGSGALRGTLRLTDSYYSGNDANWGGAISTDNNRLIIARRNLVCGNTSSNSTGGLRIVASGIDSTVLTNNVFADNDATNFGGGLLVVAGGPTTVQNNTFIGNGANEGGNLYFDDTVYTLINNIVMGATVGDGLFVGIPGGSQNYNLWWDNAAADVSGGITSGDLGADAIFADPLLAVYSADGNCENDVLFPNPGSPAIDGGDPGITDLDGSPSDVGAYGGPLADDDILTDDDGDGYTRAFDCDDNNAAVNPGAAEVCDGVDNDCDGDTDGALAPGATDWYPDDDGDGFGDTAGVVTACDAPDGYISTGGDCDDGESTVNPAGTEVCDALDNNCDGLVDEGLTTVYYTDADGDGFGDDDTVAETCEDLPADAVTVGGDCNDERDDVSPSAEEVCDLVDNDCDDAVDEDLAIQWFRDADNDGYGVTEDAIEDCQEPSGYVPLDGDCDDENPLVNPGAEDLTTDTTDQNCDGIDGDPLAGESLVVGSGCGCSAANQAPSGALLVGLLALLGLRRRQTR